MYKKRTTILVLTGTAFATLLFPYSVLNGIEFLGFEINIDAYKDFSGFVGGIMGTTLSAIAVILVYHTYRLQDQELNATKRLIREQKFEQNFFQLLNSQKDILNSLEYFDNRTSSDKIGIEYFKMVMNEIKNDYQFLIEKFIPNKNDYKKPFNNYVNQFFDFEINTPYQAAQVAYIVNFEKHHNLLGHYFRHLYHILKFIDTNIEKDSSENSFEIYKNYVDILQAQLSSAELAVLFYNGLAFKKMKALLHKYSFLENLATDDLANENHSEFYGECTICGESYGPIKMKSRKEFRNVVKQNATNDEPNTKT